MSIYIKICRFFAPVILTLSCFYGAAAAATTIATENSQTTTPVNHLVIVWFSPETPLAQHQLAIDASQQLNQITAVTSVSAGAAIPSERNAVDDSFSFALNVTIRSAAAMSDYLQHPIHKAYVEKYIKGKTSKIVIYDF